ncbi:MAG: Gfo/Idh/MocA family oxidoreductase [Planctomycetota bacterium]
MSNNQSFTFVILGAGDRGRGFAKWIKNNPDAGRVVAVAEPLAERRQIIAEMHGIKPELQFECWEDLIARPKLADVMINTTMDRLHAPSAIPALNKGYHILLEKPMATTLEDCIAIDRARCENQRIVSVCHSLRYHVVYAEIKRLLDSGAIGQLVSFDQLEAVEHIHQSHSFVRGNWGNESRSTFMLLSKSCHDVDILAYLVGKPCQRVSSFGELSYFKKENAPVGAPARCVDGCPAEPKCPYSTYKVYMGSQPHWGARNAGTYGKSFDEQIAILKAGPYGRCVFQCDNDVVDHQVTSFEFEGGVTGTFSMIAFTPFGGRRLRLHGTHGYIETEVDKNEIDLYHFIDRKHNHIQIPEQAGGHGGGDNNVLRNLLDALRTNNPEVVLTTTAESLASYRIIFAAEKARREKRVVELSEMNDSAISG